MNVSAQAGEKLFSQMVQAFKDTAKVQNARKTTTLMYFELRPTSKPSDAEQSNDDAKRIQSNAVVKPLKLDELRKLRSETGSDDVDKS